MKDNNCFLLTLWKLIQLKKYDTDDKTECKYQQNSHFAQCAWR